MTRASWAVGAAGLAAIIGAAYLAFGPAAGVVTPADQPLPQTTTKAGRSADSTAAVEPRREPSFTSAGSKVVGPLDRQPTTQADAVTGSDTTRQATTAGGSEVPTPPPTIAPAATPSPLASPTPTGSSASETSPAPVPAPSKADAQPATAVKVKTDAVIGVRLDQTVATDTAHVDDKVTARVARDVVVSDHTAIAAGARLEGVVTVIERGTRASDRGRLGIRFHTLILADDKRVAIQTDTIFRESDPASEPAAALGASGALGAMLSNGPRPGAAIGSARPPIPAPNAHTDVRIPAGSLLTVKLVAPLTIAK